VGKEWYLASFNEEFSKIQEKESKGKFFPLLKKEKVFYHIFRDCMEKKFICPGFQKKRLSFS